LGSGEAWSRTAPTYKNHRYPIDIVARAIWLYFRFNLSLRDVEEMLLERGIVVSYETIRRWCRQHGPDYARRLRRKAPTKDDVWHLDEVMVRVSGRLRVLSPKPCVSICGIGTAA
jgi:putative transposase